MCMSINHKIFPLKIVIRSKLSLFNKMLFKTMILLRTYKKYNE